MHITDITRTTLATFHLQHQDEDTLGLVDSPVEVIATDLGPGTPAVFTVERFGDVVTTGPDSTAQFLEAAEAMAFALRMTGWAQAIA